jgi:hypothetical protein
MVAIAALRFLVTALRFLVTAKKIDSEGKHSGTGSRIDVALALLLVLLGSALFFYLRVSAGCRLKGLRRFRDYRAARATWTAESNGPRGGPLFNSPILR